MLKDLDVNCYTNIPSSYQIAFYSALSNLVKLNVYFEGNLPPDRLRLGWVNKDIDSFQSEFNKRIDFYPKTQVVHFLSGFPGGVRNYIASRHTTQNIIFQSEMPTPERFRLRWLLLSIFFKKMILKHHFPLLGIGNAIRQFWRNLGLPEKIIFPFAYFPDGAFIKETLLTNPLLYVGQLEYRKGIDILIRAFSKQKSLIDRGLILIGSGSKRDEYENMVNDLGLNYAVKFLGAINSNLIQNYIANSSILILPSRHDGWGVTVNEAILTGVPVVVSDRCGASELVSSGNCGFIFESENIDDLENKLIQLSNKEVWLKFVENALKYRDKILPYKAAEYFVQIVEYYKNNYSGFRPKAPWLN